jgi:hypothetical protein
LAFSIYIELRLRIGAPTADSESAMLGTADCIPFLFFPYIGAISHVKVALESAPSVHRNRYLFGYDSGLFPLERRLKAKDEKLASIEMTIDLMFEYGKLRFLG